MKHNRPLNRLNPFARRAVHSANRRRGPHSPRRLAFEGLESKNLLTTFTVDSVLDTEDANPGDGVAEDDDGNTTLDIGFV